MNKLDLNEISIAFDFDGVICDSQYECFFIAFEVFKNTIEGEKINDSFFKKNLNNFYKLRHLVYSGEDYLLIIFAVYSKISLYSHVDFVDFKKSLKKYVFSFRTNFYEARKQFQEKNLKNWLSMNKIYPEISKLIETISSRTKRIYIVTTKDLKSVCLIKDFYGLEIEDENITSVSKKLTKEQALKNILNRNNDKKIIFIEDRYETLIDIKNKKINKFLATWGYNDKSHYQNSSKHKIEPVTINQLINLFSI